ncbi:MAG: hypothetical protein ACK5KT_01505 [Dysgonomonas sp.]
MKTIFPIAMVILSVVIISCSSDKAKTAQEKAANSDTVSGIETETNVQLTPLDGYFTTVKPLQVDGLLIKNQSEFDKNFHPAKTMANSPTKIDFINNHIGAIVMPATEYDTKIIINKSYVKANVLYIYYSIDKSNEKRTFTTIPQLLFTFNSSLAVDSIYLDR